MFSKAFIGHRAFGMQPSFPTSPVPNSVPGNPLLLAPRDHATPCEAADPRVPTLKTSPRATDRRCTESDDRNAFVFYLQKLADTLSCFLRNCPRLLFEW